MILNQGLLNADGLFDTAQVSVHVTLVHQLTQQGSYLCQVKAADSRTRQIAVTVGDNTLPTQTDLDCQALFEATGEPAAIMLAANGYIVFYAGFGDGRFEVQLTQAGTIVFDSQAVGANSIIVISPLVPGIYTVTDQVSGAEAKLEVQELAAHVNTKNSEQMVAFYESLRNDGPLAVTITATGFQPARLLLIADQPMQVTGPGPMRLVSTLGWSSKNGQ